jgi:hypothetical protein
MAATIIPACAKKRFGFNNFVSEFRIDPEAFAAKLCLRFG